MLPASLVTAAAGCRRLGRCSPPSGWSGMQNSLSSGLSSMGMSGLGFGLNSLSTSTFGMLAGGLGSLGMSLLSGQGLNAKTGLSAGGAALGSLLGPAGSVVGGILGSIVGGLFGDDKNYFGFG